MDHLPPQRPELLAPAGEWESLRAAVVSGADAVYFGLPTFNARQRATNFALADLAGVLAWASRARRAASAGLAAGSSDN